MLDGNCRKMAVFYTDLAFRITRDGLTLYSTAISIGH